MAQFVVKVQSRGTIREIDLEADSEAAARVRGTRFGRVLDVRKSGNRLVRRGMRFSERNTFFLRLSAMLASGLGAGESLQLLRDTFRGRIKQVAHTLLLKIESGDDLVTAIESMGPPDFPESVVALIRAGSVTGMTHEAIREAGEFERTMRQIRQGSMKGLGSAVFMFFLSAVFIVGSVFWGMPKVMDSPMMKMAGDSVNIQWAVDLANWVGYFMVAVVAVSSFLILLATVGRQAFPVAADWIIMKIPFYKDLLSAQKNYISFYGMSLLVRTGVRMETALALTAELTPKGMLRSDLLRARQAILKGKPWAQEMRTLHDTDRAALAASLDRTQVAKALQAIADQYKEIYAERVATFVPIMQSLGALLMMLAGVIMFSVTILPMLQMMKSVL